MLFSYSRLSCLHPSKCTWACRQGSGKLRLEPRNCMNRAYELLHELACLLVVPKLCCKRETAVPKLPCKKETGARCIRVLVQ